MFFTSMVFVRRMRSPAVRNAQRCASMYMVTLEELTAISNKRAWSVVYQNLVKHSWMWIVKY